ncbi:alpha/beta fold hydrolase [Kitasatospora camelliae]|uniref:Alpha/beta hydrolase family protein n=1 Tax=Kitasatospora camelliae TaxID=3156397 RepID=A0AAU8K856_9ACTN
MLSEIGLDRVNILGGSYGTALAYRIAQIHPERVTERLPTWARVAGPPPPGRRATIRVRSVPAPERWSPAPYAVTVDGYHPTSERTTA